MKNFLLAIALFMVIVVAAAILQLLNVPQQAPAPTSEKVEISVAGNNFLVEIADTPQERARGLSGRESLAENEGMLFVFDEPEKYVFVMAGMQFPIDIIWINGNEVVGFEKNVQPAPSKSSGSYPSPVVDKVLEVSAGTVDRLNIQSGDTINL